MSPSDGVTDSTPKKGGPFVVITRAAVDDWPVIRTQVSLNKKEDRADRLFGTITRLEVDVNFVPIFTIKYFDIGFNAIA
jgi:hypothetical protein